ncbi:hypothetical protein Bca4012_019009 [Brassica carinata]
MRKRMRQSEDNMVETDMASPHISIPHKSTTETLLVSHPQCCKTTEVGSSNSAGCPFQALGEHLIGMKLSTNNEGERACIVASHPSSGLSFTLTWLNNSNGEEDELLYKVKNIAMEILDIYENYRIITDEKVSSAFNKLTLKPM